MLPEGTLEYFDLERVYKDKEGLKIYLEEKNIVPSEYKDETLHSKGFLPEMDIRDFPIRKHKVLLSIKRRRWEVVSSGEIVTRNWDLVMSGTRITKEFGLFLKGALG
ncbi:MAG: transposase [Bacteroidetes bacterium]|nr:transposase [Bacteroidota bacterium]